MHEIDRWKKSLLTLADGAFFDLMRNYLGELRTPFNKHALIEELVSFLRRPATIERIIDLVDESDAELLTALHLLGEPSIDRLRMLLEGERGYLELHRRLLNLEERLLCYRERFDGHERIRLNPILRDRLAAEVLHSGLLFPSIPAKASPVPAPWLAEPLLAALFSYLIHVDNPLKSSGGFRKRVEDELLKLIPALRVRGEPETRLAMTVRALETLGLLEVRESSVIVRVDCWRALAALDSPSLLTIVWTSAAFAPNGYAPDGRATARRAGLVVEFLLSIDESRAYTIATLHRLMSAHAFANDAVDPPIEAAQVAPAISGLVAIGVLVPAGRGAYRLNPATRALLEGPQRPPSARAQGPSGEQARPEIVLQPNFSITVEPGITFDTALTVALFADLRQLDVMPRYEITKQSFLRGLDRGIDGATLCETLARASGRALPQNVQFSIESWESEFRSVTLYSGIVLAVDADRRHLIDHSEVIRPWIRKVLAPGVYLLDPREQTEWRRALERLSITPLPEIRTAGHPKVVEDPPARGFEPVDAGPPIGLLRLNSDGSAAKRSAAGKRSAALRGELERALAERAMPPEQLAELSARLERRLILFPEQLSGLPPRLEKVEAKGLDYLGKVRLIEQAIGSGTELLEVLERTPAGDNRRLLVRPIEVRRRGSDLILVGESLPQCAEVHVRVRKIGLLRKLKGSIYAP